MKQEYNKNNKGQLESYIWQEWDNIPLPIVQQLLSSVSKHYRLLLKEEAMLHSGEHGPVPTFLRCFAGIDINVKV